MLTSTLLELTQADPGLDAVIPHPAPQLGLTTTRLPDVDGVLNGDGDGDNDGTRSRPRWPGSATSRSPAARPGSPSTAPVFSRLVLLPLPSDIGDDAQNAAIQAGADTRPAHRAGPPAC